MLLAGLKKASFPILLWTGFLCLSSCTGKRTLADAPTAPSSRGTLGEDYRELVGLGDEAFAKQHLLGWMQAEADYQRALELHYSPQLDGKHRLARLLRTLRQRQESEDRLDRRPLPDAWCAPSDRPEIALLCRLLSPGSGSFGADRPQEPFRQALSLFPPGAKEAVAAGASPVSLYVDLIGMGAVDEDRFEARLQELRQAFPNSPLFLYHDFRALGNELAEVRRFHDEFAESFVFEGERRFVAEKPRAAIEAFDRALALIPDYPRARLGRANVRLVTLRDYDRALEEYQRLLDRHPQHRGALYGKGLCLYYLGRNIESNMAFERLLDRVREENAWLDVDTARFYRGQSRYFQAYNHFLLGDPSLARERVDQAKLDLPGSKDVRFLSGQLAYQERRHDLADKELLSVIRDGRSIGYCRAYYYLGLIRRARLDEEFISYFLSVAHCLKQTFGEKWSQIEGIPSLGLNQAEEQLLEQRMLSELDDFREDALMLTGAMEKLFEESDADRRALYQTLMQELRSELKTGSAR